MNPFDVVDRSPVYLQVVAFVFWPDVVWETIDNASSVKVLVLEHYQWIIVRLIKSNILLMRYDAVNWNSMKVTLPLHYNFVQFELVYDVLGL